MGWIWTTTKQLAEWLFAKPPAAPELVEFERDCRWMDRHEVLLKVDRLDCLARSDLRRLAGAGAGRRYWWLRHDVFGFARLDLPRGDRPFCRWLLLPPGRYVLGVGCGMASRRMHLKVGGRV